MKKFIVAILCAVLALSTLAFAGCGHTCEFESEWTFDETNHWHVCTDENCDEVGSLGSHQMEGVICSVCGYETFEGINKWAGATDGTVSEAVEGVIEIDTADELAALAVSVNAGNNYKGITVKLTADINLDNVAWTPIGNKDHTFQGKFDGNGKTIYNLNVDMASTSYVGLFGFTTNGEINDVSVYNATVKGRLGVGVIAGSPYTSKFNDISITGLVKVDGMAYVGGAFGRNAYANISNVVINVTEGSYVSANSIEDDVAYRTYVGGLVGFVGEGGHVISNVTSNIDVYGTTIDVGGITGIAHYGNTFENCTATGNVYLTAYGDDGDQLEMGGIAGVWYNQDGSPVTIKNCSFTGTLTATNSEGVVYTGEFANNGLVGKAYSNTEAGTLVIE